MGRFPDVGEVRYGRTTFGCLGRVAELEGQRREDRTRQEEGRERGSVQEAYRQLLPVGSHLEVVGYHGQVHRAFSFSLSFSRGEQELIKFGFFRSARLSTSTTPRGSASRTFLSLRTLRWSLGTRRCNHTRG